MISQYKISQAMPLKIDKGRGHFNTVVRHLKRQRNLTYYFMPLKLEL
jgi:hypothetical protein